MKLQILMGLMLLTSFLAACTSQVASDTNKELQTDAVEVNDEMKAKDTKTEIENTQDTITQLIADATYQEEVTYNHHEGSETMNVLMTVKDDIIVELKLEGIDAHKVSEKYINGVNDELQTLSVGKSISEVESLPDQISGSSLTVAAFKEHTAKLLEEY